MSASQAVANIIFGAAGHPTPITVTLSAADAQKLKLALAQDASDYWYSGLVSLGEAIQGTEKRRFSWATVKAYYAAFYLSRAILGFGGLGLCYVGTTPYSWHANTGNAPGRLKGNTHDSVLKLFDRSTFFPALSGQRIGVVSAIDWLIEQRVAANYKASRFCDPEPTDCLVRIASGSTRTYVEAYVHDSIGIYYLDADHAMLAFPIELAKALSKSRSIVINSDERTHLRTLFSDSAGPFRVAQQFFPVV